MSLNKKSFTMSKFASSADLYKAKAEHYEQQAEKLQMEVVVLEAKLNFVADMAENLTKALDMETGAHMVERAFNAEA